MVLVERGLALVDLDLLHGLADRVPVGLGGRLLGVVQLHFIADLLLGRQDGSRLAPGSVRVVDLLSILLGDLISQSVLVISLVGASAKLVLIGVLRVSIAILALALDLQLLYFIVLIANGLHLSVRLSRQSVLDGFARTRLLRADLVDLGEGHRLHLQLMHRLCEQGLLTVPAVVLDGVVLLAAEQERRLAVRIRLVQRVERAHSRFRVIEIVFGHHGCSFWLGLVGVRPGLLGGFRELVGFLVLWPFHVPYALSDQEFVIFCL